MESPSACSRQEAAPKQKPRPSSAPGPCQPGMAGRESRPRDARQRVRGLPGSTPSQPIDCDRRQQGCADLTRRRATPRSCSSRGGKWGRGAAPGSCRLREGGSAHLALGLEVLKHHGPVPLLHWAGNKSHCLQPGPDPAPSAPPPGPAELPSGPAGSLQPLRCPAAAATRKSKA